MSNRERKQGMSREEAAQLYDQLKINMEAKFGKAGLASLIKKEKSQAGKEQTAKQAKTGDVKAETLLRRPPSRVRQVGGAQAAILLVVMFAVAKMALSLLEASGLAGVEKASASLRPSGQAIALAGGYSREEVKVLSALDERRAKLEDRSKLLDQRENELEHLDREYAARLTQIRELTDRLKIDRERNEKKRDAQLDQLANVYGSMNPQEAAQLMEQLDVTIALSLIQRMPEKRIGQILALMNPERALALTRMLSNKQ